MVDEQAVQDFVRDLFEIKRPDNVMLHPRQVADMVGSRHETFQAVERQMFEAFRVPSLHRIGNQLGKPPRILGQTFDYLRVDDFTHVYVRDPRHGIGLLALVACYT